MAIAALRFRPETNLDPLETKGGSYIYDGSVARFHEWEFRTMARIGGLTEADDVRKAINRVIEGLRGDAFDLAMDIGREKLMTIEGITALLDMIRKTIFPIEAQEAKILFAMGQKPHGPLSRQANESMTSYSSRRRRWWKMVKKLDKDMNLSDEMLGSLMLDHAGLTTQECLMVLTSTGNETSFDKIRDVLILQHSRTHLSGQKGDSKGFQRKPL